MDHNFIVCVSCMTYNHAPYIEDAMNGFCMQETTFPFVCTIVDDASTDGEQEVIEKYLQEHFDLEDKSIVRNEETDDFVLTFARHKTNHNCYFAALFLKYNHYSIKKTKLPYIAEWHNNCKYIAVCEGDDYWIDSKKLQRQVDFLKSHLDFVICSHDYVRYIENQKKYKEKSDNRNFFKKEMKNDSLYYEYSLDNYFKHWYTQPLTCLYRNGEYLNTIPRTRYKYFRDDIFYYYILKEGKGALLTNVMGVYRINDSGTWSTKNPIRKKKDSIYNAYNIYLVEGDERAISKMKRLEKAIVFEYLRSSHYRNVVDELQQYHKMVPLKHYFIFLISLFKMVLSRMKKFAL